jgi:hypothetical protein
MILPITARSAMRFRPLALRLTYQLRTNWLSVTTDRTTVALGPFLPSVALHRHGSNQG